MLRGCVIAWVLLLCDSVCNIIFRNPFRICNSISNHGSLRYTYPPSLTAPLYMQWLDPYALPTLNVPWKRCHIIIITTNATNGWTNNITQPLVKNELLETDWSTHKLEKTPGDDIDLNWSLAKLQINPFYEAFRNPALEHLFERSYGTVGLYRKSACHSRARRLMQCDFLLSLSQSMEQIATQNLFMCRPIQQKRMISLWHRSLNRGQHGPRMSSILTPSFTDAHIRRFVPLLPFASSWSVLHFFWGIRRRRSTI